MELRNINVDELTFYVGKEADKDDISKLNLDEIVYTKKIVKRKKKITKKLARKFSNDKKNEKKKKKKQAGAELGQAQPQLC